MREKQQYLDGDQNRPVIQYQSMKNQVVVIGGGASGMMAAGRAAEMGATVSLLEKTNRLGNKIRLAGNRRCNLTNARDIEDFVAMYGSNGRFLYHAFSHFFRDDLVTFLGRYGVMTRVENDGRVFPASNRAEDVVEAFQHYMDEQGVSLCTNTRVTSIQLADGRVIGVGVNNNEVKEASAVILATGGASYPETGSSGDGYRLASELGHTVVKLRPALVPLVVKEIDLAKRMQGVTLKSVRLTACRCPADQISPRLTLQGNYGRGIAGVKPPEPVIESRIGEMVITHYGISGPIALLMSLAIVDALELGPVSVCIDLFPASSHEQLQQRIQVKFNQHGKRTLRHLIDDLVPHRLVDPILQMTGLPSDKLGHQITAMERDRLGNLLKSLRFNIRGSLPLSQATVTAGGVSLNEIDPRTMESRIVRGLYFCGEVMDLDAETGGYNLQAAFSTGYVAGEAAARSSLSQTSDA